MSLWKCQAPVRGLCLGKKGSKSSMSISIALRPVGNTPYFCVALITQNVKSGCTRYLQEMLYTEYGKCLLS